MYSSVNTHSELFNHNIDCAEGWHYFGQTQLCYRLMPARMKFRKAEEACQGDIDNGFGLGNLATIRDDATFNFIVNKILEPHGGDLENTYYWTGGVYILL